MLDLWDFPKNLQASSISNELESNFFRRCPREQRPSFLHSPKPFSEVSDSDPDASPEDHGRQGKKGTVYDSSLTKALHQTFFYRWWLAGLLKLFSGAYSVYFIPSIYNDDFVHLPYCVQIL
jgi:ATP-binding cassette, subfamily C (CFTR/MRP), member 1